MQVTTIGIDLAKNVFQVHGVDAAGKVVITKKLRRSQVLGLFERLPPCLIGMEACATSHHWARELKALGHDVRLMPASYVKAYVKRGKNDAADAAAICEAVTRPTMRFVPIKTADQQALLMLHRTRDLLVRQRTQLINANTRALGRTRTGCRARPRRVEDPNRHRDGRGEPGSRSGAQDLCRPCSASWMHWPSRSARSSVTSMRSIERTKRASGSRQYLASA